MIPIDVDAAVPHSDSRFISAKISRIVELIREYDHRLDVKWVPPNLRQPTDPAFAITERLADGSEVVAFYVQDESDFDERILGRIYAGDNSKQDVQVQLEANNLAAARVQSERQKEERYAYYDLMRSMITSGKHTYKHNGKKYSL